MEKQPKEITACRVQCVLMPQGEVIFLGKTIGWFKDLKTFLSTEQQHSNLLELARQYLSDVTQRILVLTIQHESHPDTDIKDQIDHWNATREQIKQIIADII